MISVANATKHILQNDPIHLETLVEGTLNLRAYASLIQSKVEDIVKNKVQVGTIVIALSRISNNLSNFEKLQPEVKIDSLTIKSDLSVITYEKTNYVLSRISEINEIQRRNKQFFVISEGFTEITIVAANDNIREIQRLIVAEIKAKFIDVVAVIVGFDEKYVKIPNVLFTFCSRLAVKKVNLVQVVSNLTEVSFVIQKEYMQAAIESLQTFL